MGGVEEDSLSFSFFEVFEVTSFSLLFSECLKFDSFFCLSSSEAFSLRASVFKGGGWEQFSSSGFVFGMEQIWYLSFCWRQESHIV